MANEIPLSAVERMAGVEWMRGVAAFGVVCIHSGLAVHNNTDAAAFTLRGAFSFVVPYFLVLSLFFAVRSESAGPGTWEDWMRRRGWRLLAPFIFWSVVYLTLHVGKLLLHHQSNEISHLLFDDPAMVILSGGTSVALYFLPLLFIGLALVHLFAIMLRQLPLWGMAIGFLLGVGVRQLYEDQLSAISPGMGYPGSSIIELAHGLIEDALRCAPLIFIAAIFVRVLPRPGPGSALPLMVSGALAVICFHLGFIPLTLGDSILGGGAMMFAWGLSGVIPASSTATTVGLFSFGVYLVHQVVLEMIQVGLPYHGMIGIPGTLLITSITFAISMGVVGIANRGNGLVRLIFGLR